MFHMKHGKDDYMTYKDLYKSFCNLTPEKTVLVTDNGFSEKLTFRQAREKYHEREVKFFGVQGNVITVILKEVGK